MTAQKDRLKQAKPTLKHKDKKKEEKLNPQKVTTKDINDRLNAENEVLK